MKYNLALKLLFIPMDYFIIISELICSSDIVCEVFPSKRFFAPLDYFFTIMSGQNLNCEDWTFLRPSAAPVQ